MIGPVWIPGVPKGQPRPRAFARNGHVRVYDPGTAEAWKGQIAASLAGYTQRQIPGPVTLDLDFEMPRPKSHRRRDGSLKPDAPIWCTSKPDIDNAVKAVLDALTQIGLWHDDTQVVMLAVTMRYGNGRSGCTLSLAELEATP